ncbi:cell division protein FtsQ (plasmid) [Legionella adelaidensis]|uniref:Cell division protein FtsQ n=1 Tax=Legionella adelaidensis TaxID=45056 RepID=A0A0W0R5Y7_9GAMM|nr:cell division protein FtsQ/DivIB [Legionella adelaidensis]KTC66428.1 cell division protein FtsQ [Legionella adelaidensis]VEH85026.1 cell division protein FtsQ [Legionella adelaidensis]
MSKDGQKRYAGLLTLLIAVAFILAARLIYIFLSDAQRFPINTIKVAANYHHISRKQLEEILSNYTSSSFFTISTSQLKKDLNTLDWTESVDVERIWPDAIKITVVEKVPVAVWNDALMTAEGGLFSQGKTNQSYNLPRLNGPEQQQKDVLQIYQKLSKLLAIYGLQAASLELRENQAWELILSNGIQIHLGKRDLEERLQRFCKAYPLVFADKPEQLGGVDLRYARGMAVQWKQQTGR